jgi:hypothetical protein
VRCAEDILVTLEGEYTWVRWEPENAEILKAILPIPKVELYARRDENWYRCGCHLPAFDMPRLSEGRPLYEVLLPRPIRTSKPARLELTPAVLRLVESFLPRSTSALVCKFSELSKWAETAAGPRVTALRAAFCDGEILLVGNRLPLLPGSQRLWGDRVLVPLGQRLEPDLPESAVLDALGISQEELLILESDRAQVVACQALQPLTRAGLRLLAGCK